MKGLMKLFDIKLKGNEILQHIYDDFIFNRDFSSNNEVIHKLPLLIENKLAIKISGIQYLYETNVQVKFHCACKFICKYNKDNKKQLQSKNEKVGRQGMNSTPKVYADNNEQASAITKYSLPIGSYYAELKDSNYAILIISNCSNDDDIYRLKFDLYFIGKKCVKYKNKYFKMVDEYQDINDEMLTEQIIYSDRHKRPKDAVFKSFDQMVIRDKDKYVRYIDNWLEKIPIYYSKGIPCKLSILLYGKPGTGKSTFYKALAKHLGIKQICCISPYYFYHDGESNDIPTYKEAEPKVFAIDDIDCVCSSREKDKSQHNSGVMASLLEFLDNPITFYYKAKDGIHYPVSIIVATTNYYDQLDSAVKRYGRFDLQIEMDEFNIAEAEEMCNIYDLTLSDVLQEKPKKDFNISPAYLQALCIEKIDSKLKQTEREDS